VLFEGDFLNRVGVSVITGVLTSGLVSGIVQVIFKARFDRRLESHKGRLTAENAREIEHIRAESTIAAERFKKSYGLLAERQAEAVEAIYGHLAGIHLALLRLVSPGRFGGEPSDDELWKTLHDMRWAGMDHFRVKRLFLPADLGAEIDALIPSSRAARWRSGTKSGATIGERMTGRNRQSSGRRRMGKSRLRCANSKPSSDSFSRVEQSEGCCFHAIVRPGRAGPARGMARLVGRAARLPCDARFAYKVGVATPDPAVSSAPIV